MLSGKNFWSSLADSGATCVDLRRRQASEPSMGTGMIPGKLAGQGVALKHRLRVCCSQAGRGRGSSSNLKLTDDRLETEDRRDRQSIHCGCDADTWRCCLYAFFAMVTFAIMVSWSICIEAGVRMRWIDPFLRSVMASLQGIASKRSALSAIWCRGLVFRAMIQR